MAQSREEWNQPRYWSPPSRYRSEGQGRLGSWPRTAAWLEPDSNQTSMMSVSFSNVVPAQCRHLVPGGTRRSASGLYQASAPARAKNSTTAWLIFGSVRGFAQRSQEENANRPPPHP